MSVKVSVEPSVLRWALDRADMSETEKAFDKLRVSEWLRQDSQHGQAPSEAHSALQKL